MTDEWQRVREALDGAGVAGVDDLGLFVNDTTYFRPSRFDERAAGPTLLGLLPQLRDPQVVIAVAGHLRRPWLRGLDGAYDVVRSAYVRWASAPGGTAWHLGDTLCRAAGKEQAHDLMALATITEHGRSRFWVVESVWRFKAVADVEPLLRSLVADPDVCGPALSSLQRTIGAEAMLPVLEDLLTTDLDPVVRQAAEDQLRRVRRKLAKRTGGRR